MPNKQYSEKNSHFQRLSDSSLVWKVLREITNCTTKSPHSTNDLRLADDLNYLYCRFEGQSSSPDSEPNRQPPSTPPPYTSSFQPGKRHHPPRHNGPRPPLHRTVECMVPALRLNMNTDHLCCHEDLSAPGADQIKTLINRLLAQSQFA